MSSLFFSSCDDDKIDLIEINDLAGTWIITSQTLNSQAVIPYLKVIQFINIDNNQIFWTDTLDFGGSKFVFSTGNINTCSLYSENFGPFSGTWKLDQASHEVRIYSRTNPDSAWNQSAMINGHYYSGSQFIPSLFTISSFEGSRMEFSTSNSTLVMDKD